jgi:hypothetical protein
VDWLERHRKGTLANLLSRARGLLLVTTRLPLWERAISATQTPQSSLEALLASMGSATSASMTLVRHTGCVARKGASHLRSTLCTHF